MLVFEIAVIFLLMQLDYLIVILAKLCILWQVQTVSQVMQVMGEHDYCYGILVVLVDGVDQFHFHLHWCFLCVNSGNMFLVLELKSSFPIYAYLLCILSSSGILHFQKVKKLILLAILQLCLYQFYRVFLQVWNPQCGVIRFSIIVLMVSILLHVL